GDLTTPTGHSPSRSRASDGRTSAGIGRDAADPALRSESHGCPAGTAGPTFDFPVYHALYPVRDARRPGCPGDPDHHPPDVPRASPPGRPGHAPVPQGRAARPRPAEAVAALDTPGVAA